MTQHSTTRRLATVSSGTLLLCLMGAGTAMAATSQPADGSLIDPVTGTVSTTVSTVTSVLPSPTPTTSTLALPSPSPTPTSTDVVTTTVNTVTSTVTSTLQQVTGGSTPTTAPTAVPTAAPTSVPTGTYGGTTTTRNAAGTTTKAGSTSSAASTRTGRSGARTTGLPNTSGVTTDYLPALGTARTARLDTFSGDLPSLAPQQAQLMAGQMPAVAPAPRTLFGGSGDGNTPRGLFIAVATMVIGGLAAGHVKLAQNRLAQQITV